MYAAVKFLAYLVAEYRAHHPERRFQPPHAVTVGEEKPFTLDILDKISVDYGHAYLIAQVVK